MLLSGTFVAADWSWITNPTLVGHLVPQSVAVRSVDVITNLDPRIGLALQRQLSGAELSSRQYEALVRSCTRALRTSNRGDPKWALEILLLAKSESRSTVRVERFDATSHTNIIELLRKEWTSDDVDLATSATMVLRHDIASKELVTLLESAIINGNSDTKALACGVLGLLRETACDTASTICQLLSGRAETPEVLLARESLVAIGPCASTQVRQLLASERPETRAYSAEILGAWGRRSSDAEQELIAALDYDAPMAGLIAKAIVQVNGDPVLAARHVLSQASGDARLWSIGILQGAGKEGSLELLTLCGGKDEYISQAAVAALGGSGLSGGALLQMVSSSEMSEPSRAELVRGMARAYKKCPCNVVLGIDDKSRTVVALALEVLVQLRDMGQLQECLRPFIDWAAMSGDEDLAKAARELSSDSP
jgi:hypothetical protein